MHAGEGEWGEGTLAPRRPAAAADSFPHMCKCVVCPCRLLPSSVDALRTASTLRDRGALPASTQLWAVANPNTERDASLLEAKV